MEDVYLDGKTNCGHGFVFTFGDTQIKLSGYELWVTMFEWRRSGVKQDVPQVVFDALSRLKSKAKEHNNQEIGFADYCPFGDRSAATFLHREALRVCAMVEVGDEDGIDEHLIDTVVFGILMAEERRKKKK